MMAEGASNKHIDPIVLLQEDDLEAGAHTSCVHFNKVLTTWQQRLTLPVSPSSSRQRWYARFKRGT